MTLSITTATVLAATNVATVSETVTASCSAIDGSALVALGIETVVTFHASATYGATVRVYSSADGTNYCTKPTQEYDIPFTAGATVRSSFVVLPGHRYYKVGVANADSARIITGVTIWAEPQILS